MSEISISLDSGKSPKPKKPKKQKVKKPTDVSSANRKAMIGSIILGSVVVHVVILVLFGLWTVAKHFTRPEARFEMKKVVKIPPKTPEHKMNVAKHEAMTPKPVFNDKMVSTRPIEFALPEMPDVNMDQMLPLDPSELISDQVNGLVGSAALGSGLGSGFGGGGGTGSGMSFFGVQTEGERILLLFDVSSSVLNKAEKSGIAPEKIQEETLKLIKGLPITVQFSIIQFTGNYKLFTEELIPATPGNKKLAATWVEDKWTTKGFIGSAESGAVRNENGVIGVIERSIQMRPDVVFLISDASFQRKSGSEDVPYDEIQEVMEKLQESSANEIPVNFIAFEPKDEDVKEWRRILRRTNGVFREMKN